jgi:GNAT superfamily N-acetyltransferase
MRVEIENRCEDHQSYRSARVKSLFNVEDGSRFELVADLPIEDKPWSLGLVVGPSGSGKTSIGRKIFGSPKALSRPRWPADKPIIDAIAADGDFYDATTALSAVGLGSVPAWLRPYRVLSNGEQFRADLAKTVCERPRRIVIDEFTSVVDRQIARIGALSFGKAWRRTPGQAVLLSCHYDVIDWLDPDWVFDTATGAFQWRCHRRRPKIELEIRQTGWEWWPLFEPHHYLKLPKMIASFCYVAFVGGEPVAHIAFSTRPGLVEARACRLVVMPEWQGAGVGLKFLDHLCAMWRRASNPYAIPLQTLFHTSHPGLAAALRRNRNWVQVSASLHGENAGRCRAALRRSGVTAATGFGGHFRAVQGFRYIEGTEIRL